MSKLCAICGSPHRVEHAHLTHKGMGGRGSKAPADAHDTAPLCAGTGGNTDLRSCHGQQHAGNLRLWREDGTLMFCATEKGARYLRRKGISAREGWHCHARFEGVEPEVLDSI